MALVLFENTFLLDATAYNSASTTWSGLSSVEKEQALIAASETLNEESWAGVAVSATQSMAWPRTAFSFYDPTMNMIVEVAEGEVPVRLQRAVAKLALHFVEYPLALNQYTPTFDSISVGPISLSNSDPNNDPGRIPRVPSSVKNIYAPLLRDTALSPYSWWRAN